MIPAKRALNRGMGLLQVVAVVLLGSTAFAAPSTSVVEVGKERDRVDWTRGLAVSVGAAAGDLRAPNAHVARVKATRVARERARARLLALAKTVRLAAGGTVGEKLAANAAAVRRLKAAVGRAVELHVRHGADGSVVATLGLPLESIRLALAPTPGPSRAGKGPTAIVVDATAVLKAPRLGLGIGVDNTRYRGPVVFHRSGAAAGGDARLGGRVARAAAKRVQAGVLELGEGVDAATLEAARKAGALIVVVLPLPGKTR